MAAGGLSVRDTTWKSITEFQVRDAGAWKVITDAWVRDGGTWKKMYPFGLTPPNNVACEGETTSAVTIGWQDASTEEDAWEVRDDPAETLLQTVNTTTKAGTGTTYSWERTGLTEGTDYPMKVRSKENPSTVGPYSGIVTCQTKLIKPTGMVVTFLTTTSLKIDWSDQSAREQQYRLERCTGVGCSSWSLLLNLGAGVETHTDSGLSSDTHYRYRVRAERTDGVGQDSDWSNIDGKTTTDPLAAPTGFVIVAILNDRMTLDWNDGSTAETEWEVFKDQGFNHNKTSTTTTTVGTLYIDLQTGLSEDITYDWKVRATDGVSDGPFTTELMAKTKLNEPTSLSVDAVGNGTIDISWTRNSGVNTNVRIEKCAGGGCSNFTLHATVGQVTSAQLTGLTNGTLYRIRVRNEKAGNDSAFSNIVQDTPVASTAPVLDTVVWDTSGAPACEVDVDWSDNSPNEDNFQVWRCTGASCNPFAGSDISGNLAANTVHYSDTTAAASTTYVYGVRKKDVGDDEDSNTIQLTTGICPA